MTSELHIVAGKIDGNSYLLLSSDEPPVVTSLKYGQSDKFIEKMLRARRTCKVASDSIVTSEWTKWLEVHQRPVSEYSIMEYRHFFKNKLPYWAVRFAVRNIYKAEVENDPNKISKLLPEDVQSLDHWSIERELLIPDRSMGREVIVERVHGINSTVNKVTLINLGQRSESSLPIHEEIKVGKNKWSSSTRDVENIRVVNTIWSSFRDLPNMWSAYF